MCKQPFINTNTLTVPVIHNFLLQHEYVAHKDMCLLFRRLMFINSCFCHLTIHNDLMKIKTS